MNISAAKANTSGTEPATANLNSSKDAPRHQAACGGRHGSASGSAEVSATEYSVHTESLYMKVTNKDGDVLELRAETTEESFASETLRYGKAGRGREGNGGFRSALDAGVDAKGKADKGKAADGSDAQGAEETDPKAKQLADLREWAKEVEREVRKQQRAILEQVLRQSGKRVDSGDGKFLVVCPPADGAGKAQEPQAEAQVPEYWNAENTSDRIVHFATQMAEISGLDPKEFVEKIKDAIQLGFDQAKQATGELTGAAGKLNQDTHDLVFSKLSKWLEDHQTPSV